LGLQLLRVDAGLTGRMAAPQLLEKQLGAAAAIRAQVVRRRGVERLLQRKYAHLAAVGQHALDAIPMTPREPGLTLALGDQRQPDLRLEVVGLRAGQRSQR